MTLTNLADNETQMEGHALSGEGMTLPEVIRLMLRIEKKLDKALDEYGARISRLERYIYILIGLSLGSTSGSIIALIKSIGGM